jgi:hypothetical protein
MELRIRELMELAAGDPPHRIPVAAVRRRVRRRRLAEGVVAATSAVVLASLGLVAAQATGGRPGPAAAASSAAAKAGAPAYYYEQGDQSAYYEQGDQSAVIRATATGKVTGHVVCPWRTKGVAPATVAVANGSEFYLACDAKAGSQIYRFGLTRSGRVSGYALVRGGALPGLNAHDLAVTPGGGELAVMTGPPKGSPATQILVISTRTGATATWTSGPAAGGITGFRIGDPSFARDGRELAFRAEPSCVKGTAGAACRAPGIEVRAVSPATAGGALSQSRVLVRQSRLGSKESSFINDAFISPDGSAVTVADIYQASGAHHPGSVSVLTVSAATGRRTALVYSRRIGGNWSYQFMSSDPTGRFVLLDAGPGSSPVNGWIDHGKLVPLKPAGSDVFYEAW